MILNNKKYNLINRLTNIIRSLLVLICIFLNFKISVKAQTVNELKRIDSFQKLLPTLHKDTDIIFFKNKLSLYYKGFNTEIGIKYGLDALEQSKTGNWKKGEGYANYYLGMNYANRSEFEKAKKCYFNAINIFEKINLNFDKASVLNDLGEIYSILNNNDSVLIIRKIALGILQQLDTNQPNVMKQLAVEYRGLGLNYLEKDSYKDANSYFFKSLKIYEELEERKGIPDVEDGIADIETNIGLVEYKLQDYTNALIYWKKALKINAELKDSIKLGEVYANIATVFNAQQLYDSALSYHFIALNIFRDNHLDSKKGRTLVDIGDVYKNKLDFSKALENYIEGLKLSVKEQDLQSVYNAEGSIGEVYILIGNDTTGSIKQTKYIKESKKENFLKAIEYLKKSVSGCRAIGDLEGLQTFTKDLAEANKCVGNYKEAFENYFTYKEIHDSIFNEKNKESLLVLETERNKQVAEKTIQIYNLKIEAEKDRTKYFSIGIIILLAVIGLVVKNNFDQKKSNVIITKEKKRSDELLLNILPSEVAEELKDKGSAEAKFFNEVTVLFTDFVGFTKVSEKLTPQELVNELDACFKGFDAIMGKYNIEKIKTVGDAYLAVCGLPALDENHAEKIILAGLDIIDLMKERKKLFGERTFDVRVGAHTGSVVAGIVGVKKFAYDIWGDTVNTAARMEQNSQPMRINISEHTYEIIQEKFVCTYRGKIQAKNKGELSMYFVDAIIPKEII